MGKTQLIVNIRAILRQYPYVLKAELFGSQQREDGHASSDVNIIVLFDPETRPKGLGIYEVELALEEKLGMPVDLVQMHLLHNFVSEGIGIEREVIYEKAS